MASFSLPPQTETEEQKPAHDVLREWFIQNGGLISKVEIAEFPTAGYGLQATEQVQQDEVIVEVPFNICLSVESAKRSLLSDVIAANSWLLESQDELLALHLMNEKDDINSFFAPYFSCLPTSYETPLFWNREERLLLEGTNVGLLTSMMANQIEKDWENLYLPMKEAFPELLKGISLEKYRWALSTIYSRAFGFFRDGRYTRVLAPVMCFVNHDSQAATELDDILEFDEGLAVLRMKAGIGTSQGSQCFALYGKYSNAKLLYSYGFVLENNPFKGVDFWLKVPPSDPNYHYKHSLLQANPLTANQEYNFSGTLRGGEVSAALMATLRIIHMATQEEFNNAAKAFSGRVSTRNEVAAISSLTEALKRKIANYSTSREEDEAELQQVGALLESGNQIQGEERIGCERKKMALTVRLSDKTTIQETIDFLEQQLAAIVSSDEKHSMF